MKYQPSDKVHWRTIGICSIVAVFFIFEDHTSWFRFGMLVTGSYLVIWPYLYHLNNKEKDNE